MQDKKIYDFQLGDRKLEVQIGELAEQASGCALARYGDTSVLCTAQMGQERAEMGFFPLTCDYEERFYAAGKILGSRFIRREGRPTSEAVLNSRMIDRAVRPLFPKELTREVQVIATCLSWDAANDPAVLGLLGASLALGLSEIPWQGPVAAVRVGEAGGSFILNPNYEEREKSALDIVFAAIEEGKELLVNMIEARGEEAAETLVAQALDFALPYLRELIGFQKKIISSEGKEKVVLDILRLEPETEKEVKKFLADKIEEALFQKEKQKRNQEWLVVEEELLEKFGKEPNGKNVRCLKGIFLAETERIFKKNILEKEKRPDGRKLDEIREMKCEAAVLPRTHGSGVFVRGETRILSILTLGAPGDQQLLEGMEISGKKRFLHHYNFPPYSSGEIKRLGSPGRREIGHGMLAEKALLPLIPSSDEFPYTIRVVSEALSSNGSTSMGSVSAASLALMDAGVPLKKPAAGISVGLVIGGSLDDFKLLTDIQGPEDHHGEMDLKVAGTDQGITAIQMDVKTKGLTRKMLVAALEQAKKARLEILATMRKTIDKPRAQISPFAPHIYVIEINPEKIGAVIGTGGKIINKIIDECGVTIDIEDTGQVFITAEKDDSAQKAIEWIKNLTREFKVGEVFQGKVKRILDFGAFVEITPGQEGLVHISEFVDYRIERLQDLIKLGDIIPVEIISIDEQGRLKLSAKAAGFKPPSTAKPSGTANTQEKFKKPRRFW